jgi:hypothetical protein
MRRARPYHPMRDRKASALGRALSPSPPPAVAGVTPGASGRSRIPDKILMVRVPSAGGVLRARDCIERSEIREPTRFGLPHRAATRNGDALIGARCSDLDVAAYERFVEIWQR